MLEELGIRGLGPIDEVRLPLGPGLTALTGETGAGKTMVVTGLLLLFGGRADAARVRPGDAQAVVDGRVRVDVGSAVAARVADAGGELDEDGTVLLRRVISSAGRSRAYVGGAAVPVGVLAELGDHVVTVHGQADQLRLARPAEQRAALDRFAGASLIEYRAALDAWQAAGDELARSRARTREMAQEADLLRHGIAEIDDVDPQPGEDVQLATLSARLTSAEALRVAARQAHDALVGDADDLVSDAADVRTLLAAAARTLAQVRGHDPALDVLAGRFTDLAAAAADIGADLSAYLDELTADPQRLADVQQRRADLARLIRKYGEDIDDVLAWSADAQRQLADVDGSDAALAALAARREVATRQVAQRARELTRIRTAAAAELGAAVSAELAGLAMPGARLDVQVHRRPPVADSARLTIDGAEVAAARDGTDDIAFMLQPHSDSAALPVQRGASGGELSRVMLAVEVCLATTDPVPTMVFDEVDAGVGGRAAIEVGRRLARLARHRQVIVVTHLAQVAAYADQHVVVDRRSDGVHDTAAVRASDVRTVDGSARIAELARMLAGRDSLAARDHAAELLATAAADEHEDLAILGRAGSGEGPASRSEEAKSPR